MSVAADRQRFPAWPPPQEHAAKSARKLPRSIVGARLESEHLHVAHMRQCTKFELNGVGQHLIHTDDRNGILFGGLAAEVKRRDVDIGLSQNGAQRADETRLVQIVDRSEEG